MRVVVTGAKGQVAASLAELAPEVGHELVAIGRPELELGGERLAIALALERARPDVIVSAAAYTAVDRAEAEPDLAFAVNARGAGSVAAAAAALGVPLVHLSTDYVFDGRKLEPYVEEDPVGPTGVYGRSKLEGEELVRAAHHDVAILRTAWVYSPFGANFVRTMLKVAESRDQVSVVADQYGNPTSALDIARAVLAIAEQLTRSKSPQLRGIFHMTGSGEASWAELADHVFAASAALGGPSARVHRIPTADYPTPARRPSNSRLNCQRLSTAYGVTLPDWHQSVSEVVRRLVQSN
ncbi:dTDP-4-dehydrorhamnose reductase [Sphingomonas sp. BN140010]|uniref:dTDP-4-dehydrorhamnose reductase n=1 Tax=Sphingomonas arvum TaxID=2992113 RepID=A0ABT3JCC1_9SPHN|nr:dTDP-4-dehydrorhamnose reductase [Sphingomonas sp. BN140010]MCW3796681.1 dTDP-4-dehydrorhamnose reductase [Sphingomonas sp. BN140010]